MKCQNSTVPIYQRQWPVKEAVIDINDLQNTPDNFEGGKLRHYVENWELLTTDPWVLNTVSGSKIDFESSTEDVRRPNPIRFNRQEAIFVDQEVNKLASQNIIQKVEHCEGEFISSIFLRPKKDGTFRMILNLKNLNETVEYQHFKMDTLKSALNIVTKNCYFGSCDLSQAYYCCPIHPDHQKYLRFIWKGNLYQFNCFVNGLAEAPRKFTKIMKVAFSELRKMGHSNVHYIDDSLLTAESYEDCVQNITDTVHMLDDLGFTIHPKKSVLYPAQNVTFLGFNIDSVSMTVQLTDEKLKTTLAKCQEFLDLDKYTIRQLAQIIGKLVSTEPGFPFAPLFYRTLEIHKTEQLAKHKGIYDAKIKITDEVKTHLRFWIRNLPGSYKCLKPVYPDYTIRSDSSDFGWGGVMLNSELRTNGLWSSGEKLAHINFKELHAAFLCLQSFTKDIENAHVRLELDNTTAISYINNMGGRKPELNNLGKQIWYWALQKNLWLSSSHIAGVENIEADAESRKKGNKDTEWKLCPNIFQKIQTLWPYPFVDLFASRLNHQLEDYVAWLPDPKAYVINAMTISWSNIDSYIFPPFSMIGPVLQKLDLDESSGTLVAPVWPTQHWFAKLLKMTTDHPRLLPGGRHQLSLPWDDTEIHPLARKLHLAAFRISGKVSERQAFQRSLPRWPPAHGGAGRRNNMGVISRSGTFFAMNGKTLAFSHLH